MNIIKLYLTFFFLILGTIISLAQINVRTGGSTYGNFFPCNNTHLYDPGGAGNYANNSDGFTIIPGRPGATITISGNYTLESPACTCDHIYVYTGAGIGGTQVVNITNVVSGTLNYTGAIGQTLTVRFYSDGGVTASGFDFTITYSSGTCPSSTTLVSGSGTNNVACGTNSIIKDYAGDNDYGNYQDHYSVLNASGPSVISINGAYDIEPGCNCDYIYIRNGSGTGGSVLASYINSPESGVISYTGTAGQTLTVQFHSDANTVYAGFNAEVTYSGTLTAGSISGVPASICEGSNITYTYSGGNGTFDSFEYQWDGTGGAWTLYSTSNPANWTSSWSGHTLYMRAKITNCGSVVYSANVSTLVNPVVAGSIASVPATTCPSSNITYSYSGGSCGTFDRFEYQWDGTGGAWTDLSTSNPYVWSVWNPGHTLYVRAKVINGAVTSYSANVSSTVNSISVAPTSVSGTTTICTGSSTTLTQVGGTLGTNAAYNWFSSACGEVLYEHWLSQPYSTTQTTVNSVSGSILNVTSTGIDPMLHMENIGTFNPAFYKYINIRYRVVSGTAGGVEIFFTNTAYPAANAAQQVNGVLISDAAWHILNIDMSVHANWDDSNIKGWRYDWCTANGVNMELDYISLSSSVLVGQGASVDVAPTSNTTYFVGAQGACNATSCASTLVTINTPVSITTQPVSITRCVGASASFSVVASGIGLTYQWRKDGSNIGGATSSSYSIASVVASNAAGYDCVVSTVCGSVTSSVAYLYVDMSSIIPSSITATPASPICNGSSTSLSITGGVMAYYPFTSDVNDYSGNGLNLTGSGGSFSDGGIQLTTGSSYSSSSTTILNTNNFTISFDMKYTATSDGSWRKIFGYEPSGSDRSPGIWKYPGSMQMHWRFDAGNTGLTEASTYTLNQWYHIVGVKAGSTFTLYVDGVQVDQGTVANPKFPGNAPLWFGGAPVILKEFKIYYGDIKWYTGGCGTTYIGVGDVISVSPSAATTYYVRTEGICTTTGCVNTTINVNPVTAISVHPVTQTICAGSGVTFTVTASGTSITYQWRKNGGNIGGATASSYNIPSVVAGDAGNYDVVVSGTCGNATSNTAVLTVNAVSVAATSATATPGSVCSGSSSTLSLTGGTLGTGATWNWYSGSCGGTFVGEGSSVAVSPTSTTTYYVRAEGTCNNTACVSTTVTINTAPAIIVQPASQSICVGSPVTFSVTATGAGLTYQWRKNGSNIGGATASSYNIGSVVSGDAANYDVVITGTCGNATSSVAILTVNTFSVAATGASASPSTICIGSSSTLSVTGGTIGSGASWMWYTGSCGGTLAGTGASLVVSPVVTTTYWVRASGYCNTTTCVNTTVTVSATAVPTPNAGIDQYICLSTATMAASAATGTGAWTLISGPGSPTITIPSSAVTTITGLVTGTYVFRWTDTVSGCTNYDDVVVFVQ